MTNVQLVPTMIYRLLDFPELDRYDLSSMRTIGYGSAPMATERLREAIERIGPIFCQTLGQTESSSLSICLSKQDHVDALAANDLAVLASCGRPINGVDVRIVDDDDNDVPVGTMGELAFRGDTVMRGYWNAPEATAAALRGGWLHTGDMAREDARGFITLVDRKKDIIISGGLNISAREVEEVIYRHPGVRECAVIAVPHDAMGRNRQGDPLGARRQAGCGRRDHGTLPRQSRQLQAADQHRVHRRIPEKQHGQNPQARPQAPLLGRPRAARQLSKKHRRKPDEQPDRTPPGPAARGRRGHRPPSRRPGRAQSKKLTLRAVTVQQKTQESFLVVQRWADEVGKRSNGMVEVIVSGSEAVPGGERDALEGVRALGVFDVCHVTTAVLSTIEPKYGLPDLPFLFPDREHAFKVADGPDRPGARCRPGQDRRLAAAHAHL